MDFVSYFKQLYSGKDALRKHLLLFSVVGVMALLLNNVASAFTNNILTEQITVGPDSTIEIFMESFFGIVLWFHIFGYEYKFLSDIMNNRKVTIPEFDDEVLFTSFKMVPIFLLWQIYFFAVSFFTGIYTIATQDLVYYFLAGTLLLFFTPFVFMIYVKFSKDFKYTRDVIIPWYIARYIDRGLVDIVLWTVKFAAYTLIPAAFFVGYFDWAIHINSQLPRLIAYLGGICICSYIFTVYKLIYGLGMAQIVKEKFL
jgi:hypothetical protein